MISITLGNMRFSRGVEFIGALNGSVSILAEGHALFDDKGSDIVCSAVSALAQTLVRSISIVGGINQDLTQKSGLLRTEVKLSELDEEKKNFKGAY